MAISNNSISILAPVHVIRTETVLSRYPIHRLAKRGEVSIDILRKDENGATTFRWEVSHSSRYGQPGPLAYKLDTLVINRRIEGAGRPLAKVIRLGSLRQIADELDLGADTNLVRRALLQNAFAGITMKGAYKSHTGEERTVDAAFTRYAVVMTGQKMLDGQSADAVYIVLNDIFQEILNNAILRPLDYDYLKILAPAAQRWYELVSYQMYAALKYDRPRAKMAYSEFCACSTITRYPEYEQVKKQMHKIHKPHLTEEYLDRVEMEPFLDEEGLPDWLMWYWPGRRAKSQYEAFLHRRKFPRLQGDLFPDARVTPNEEREILTLLVEELGTREPVSPLIPTPSAAPLVVVQCSEAEQALIEELTAQGLNRADAVRFARECPDECTRQLDYLPFVPEFKSSRGAYLRSAIEQRYGPPKGYEKAEKEQSDRRKWEARESIEKARQSHQEAHRTAYLAYVAREAERINRGFPDAFGTFTEWDEEKRKVKLRLARGKIGQKLLADFDTEQARLLRVAEFFHGHAQCSVLSFWEWDVKENPDSYHPHVEK
jgi:hypothetical protein